ncbi:MAG: hypothetical protein ACOY90_02600 [Candidatus Zhuqueibacterota bacterium]
MQTHIGKAIRINDILQQRSLLLDTTIASSIGAPPQAEDLRAVLHSCCADFDGVIVNPGQMEHLSEELCGKNRAAGMVRVDWTNAYRDADFCLPVTDVWRIEISSAGDAMALGASAAVATLLMGYSDEFEATNIRSISHLLRQSYKLALPVFVDIRPIGPKVSEVNFEDTIKLGVSFMMEAGADAMIVPVCRRDVLSLIAGWSTVPVIARADSLLTLDEFKALCDLGLKGVMFSEKILQEPDYLKSIHQLKKGRG